MKSFTKFIAAAAFAAITLLAAAAENGYLGLALDVDADGFFSPTLKFITISKVAAGSPSATAGLVPGDQIVEIEGHQIPGAKLQDVQPLPKREVGQSVRLTVRGASGDVKRVSLVAVPKP